MKFLFWVGSTVGHDRYNVIWITKFILQAYLLTFDKALPAVVLASHDDSGLLTPLMNRYRCFEDAFQNLFLLTHSQAYNIIDT